jgi:predicted RNase H-like HicB family nuclease
MQRARVLRRLHRRQWWPINVQYTINLYWSQDDQAFIAKVPELAGCATDGPTYAEAVANAKVVIQQWIETAQHLGRPIPAPHD